MYLMEDRSCEDSSNGDFKDSVKDQAASNEEPNISEEKKEENTVRIVPEEEFETELLTKAEKKKERSVPLLAFVASLLAVVLVCSMFTVAIASATRRLGYTEAVRDLFAPGEDTGDGSENGNGLVDFSELEFLDYFFKTYSYDDLSDADYLTAVLKAYVAASGDLYAQYYTQEEFDAMTAENTGEGVGIGVSVTQTTVDIDGVAHLAMEVTQVFANSPAYHADMRLGDLVVYVGVGEARETVASIGYSEALNRIRGKKGTVAEFTVLRPQSEGGYKEVEFRVTRDEYVSESVEYRISETDPSVGIVRILQFDLTTPTQFSAAMDALTEQGIERFVFDVRNNPGGDLKSICAVLSYFLEEGDLIISAVDRNGLKEEYFAKAVTYTGDQSGCSIKASDIGKYRDYEMKVLTNENTASAAELFTATMRDYQLAEIVGTTTYGKGSMQSIFPLYYWGYEGAVKLTTRHYFPPCGEGYDGIGIAPDIAVELPEALADMNIYKIPEAEDTQLQAALSAFADAD